MVKIAILGSAGMIGQEILSQLNAGSGPEISRLIACDVISTPVASPLAERTVEVVGCLLYTSPSPRDLSTSRMPSSA